MKVDKRPRDSGKTIAAINWVQERVIIVINQKEKQRLIESYNLGEHQVMTFEEARASNNTHSSYYIDNADLVLQQMLDSPIEYISLTDEEDRPPGKIGEFNV